MRKHHLEEYPEKFKIETTLSGTTLTTQAKGEFNNGEKMFLRRKMIAIAMLEYDAGGEYTEVVNPNSSFSLIFRLGAKRVSK